MSVETSAKTKLAALMNDVQPVIDSHIAEMNSSEINYMLDKIPEFLRIDLKQLISLILIDFNKFIRIVLIVANRL